METLNITKEAAVKAHENATSKGKSLLEDLFGKKVFVKNIRDRIQGWNDILEINGMTQKQFDEWCKGLPEDEIGYRAEKMIVEAYNEGREPDFDDNTPKYYPVFDFSGGGFRFDCAVDWRSSSSVGARLLFLGPDAKANMLDAVEKFLPQYKQSRTF